MSIIKQYLATVFILTLLTSYVYSQESTSSKDPSYIQNYMPNFSTSKQAKSASASSLQSIIINDITVKGNDFVSSEKIITFAELTIGKSISEYTLTTTKKKIKRKGPFQKVTVSYDKKTQLLTITVVENPIITDIIFDGIQMYSKENLLALVKSKINQPLNMGIVRTDINMIESTYKEDGYIEAKIYNIERPETDDGPLVFKIAEGIIDDIVITGNVKTQDYVILRELDIRPGDVINKNELESNIRQIFNLNYFDNIIPDLSLTEEPHHYKLILNLVEKETSGAFTFGGGFQPNRGFNLFSDLYWDNLMGKGQLIMLKGNFGLGAANYSNRNNTYQFKFSDPWAFGKRRSFTFRIWSSSGSFQSFNLLNQQYAFKDTFRRGIDTEFGIPHTYDFRTSHKIKYESVRITDDNVHYYLYTYTFRTTYDKRNQKLNPTNGYYVNFSMENGFKFRPKAIDLTRFDLILQKFFPTFDKQVIFLQSKFGFLRSPQVSNETIFVDEYYYVGGSYSVRGYHDNEPFGYGNKQIIGTIEYRYIFAPNVTGYFFADVGYASKIQNNNGDFIETKFTNLSEYNVTKGIGVNFVINPIGPIRLHFGVTEKNIGRVQFNLGYTF